MDEFDQLKQWQRQRQSERGFTEFFRVGDSVRFPQATARWNRNADYKIEAIYTDGFEVTRDGCRHQPRWLHLFH